MSENAAAKRGSVPHTVIVETRELQKLAEFYRHGLELGPPKATGDDHLGFQTGTVYFGFDRVERDRRESPGAISVWFEVDDLGASFQRFIALGAQVRYPPTKKPWGAILAAVSDPDGNIVGLSQRGAIPNDAI